MGQDRDGCGQTGESEAERFTASSRGRCQFAPEKFDKVIHELTLALNHENCPHPNPLPSEWARGFLGSFVTLARFSPRLIRLRHTASDASVLRRTLADAGEGRVRALSSGLFSKVLEALIDRPSARCRSRLLPRKHRCEKNHPDCPL